MVTLYDLNGKIVLQNTAAQLELQLKNDEEIGFLYFFKKILEFIFFLKHQ